MTTAAFILTRITKKIYVWVALNFKNSYFFSRSVAIFYEFRIDEEQNGQKASNSFPQPGFFWHLLPCPAWSFIRGRLSTQSGLSLQTSGATSTVSGDGHQYPTSHCSLPFLRILFLNQLINMKGKGCVLILFYP